MKLRPLLFAFLIWLAAVQFCFSQEKPKAVLFDKFSETVEEETSARVDIFMGDLINEPTSQGYVVIHPKKDSANKDFVRERRYEKFIKNKISLQKFDKSRIEIIRSEVRDEIELELWKVQPGAEKPFLIVEKWSEILPDLSKAFVFGISYPDQIFPNFIPEFYADYINKNENLRGNIVVYYNYEWKNYLKNEAKDQLKTLTKEYKIPRNRLKVYYKKIVGEPYIEFWLVPKKKK
jgi:hypothetical protein